MPQNSSSQQKANPPRVVIIGAGFGGIACANKLARNKDLEIILVDRRNHHLFQPLLYQVATSTLTAPDIARSVRSIFRKKDNVQVCYDHVSSVDLENKVISLASDAEMHYDYLVIAAGATTSYFGNDQWAQYTHELKSLSDAFEIRKAVLGNLELAERSSGGSWEGLRNVVIVGGGPTGVELAGSFADLLKRIMKRSFRHLDTQKLRIILVEGQTHLLGAFHEKQGICTRKHLEEIGVEVRTEAMVENISENEVTLRGGEVIQAGTIIWAAGVQAAPLTKKLNAPITRSGQVIVQPDLNIAGHEDCYVIGDAAAVELPDGSFVPGVAPAAAQGGLYVGKRITNLIKGKSPGKPFSYRDKGKMAIIGKGAAVVDVGGCRINGWCGWLVWLFIHVLFLVDFRSKLAVLINWFWAYIHNAPGSRVFTTASGQDKPDDNTAPKEV